MFIDDVVIKVVAGNGGDGCTAFRREKFVPMGGPFGGNGGRGSNIVFEVDEGLHTLLDLRYQKMIKGKKGENGRGKNQHGKGAEPIIIKVPQGTVVTDLETGLIIADLSKKDQQEIIAKGGRGGRGNSHFATSTRQAPRFSEDGDKGEEKEVILELKLLADVGLLGYPNVGKSTFLSKVTDARPKIANYHFTTLEPNLGVVKTKSGNSFVIADIPGIIEGASEGVGLGLQFLRHIERTRLLLHFIDVSGEEGRDPVEDYYAINKELKKYSEKLSQRKQILVATKIDVIQDETRIKKLEELAQKENLELYKISAVTGEGVQNLIDHVSKVLETLPKEELIEIEEKMVYTLKDKEQEWTARREGNTFIVEGRAVDRLMGRINIEDNESMYYFHKCLKNMGIDDKLKELGVCDGDTVIIAGWELEWEE